MTNLSTVHRFSIGDRVVCRDVVVLSGQPPVANPYPRLAGATATVVDIDCGILCVKWDTYAGDHGRDWGSVWFEPAGVEVPQRPLVHAEMAEAFEDFEIRASDDLAKIDHELICPRCDNAVCDVEVTDSLGLLVRVALDHLSTCTLGSGQ